MSHISTKELSSISGLTTRQVQRLAINGDIPGAIRTPGNHWVIPDNDKVRKWAKGRESMRLSPKNTGNAVSKKILKIQKAVVAAESLVDITCGDFETRYVRDVISDAAKRLTSVISDDSTAEHRGGSWKGLEGAAKEIRDWYSVYFKSATTNEKQKFASIVRSISRLSV